jgi:hypothetical protein
MKKKRLRDDKESRKIISRRKEEIREYMHKRIYEEGKGKRESFFLK